MGFFQILFVILLILQLTGTICISWWLVFMPLIIPVAILITIVFVCGILGIAASVGR